MSEPEQTRFDPFALMQALDRHRVRYIVIGAVGRVIRGSGELTEASTSSRCSARRTCAGSVWPSTRSTRAGPTAASTTWSRSLAAAPVLELQTDRGQLKIVSEPAGTRGYDDLRRAASREPLGRGLRPSIASAGDLARMLAALNREQDRVPLRRLRRLIELDHELGRSRGIER